MYFVLYLVSCIVCLVFCIAYFVFCTLHSVSIAIISNLDTSLLKAELYWGNPIHNRPRISPCIVYFVFCTLYFVFCTLYFVFCIYRDHIQSWHLSTEATLSTTDPVSRPLTLDGSFYPRKDQINFGLWTSLILGEVLSLLHFIVLKIGRIEHTEIILVRLRMIQRDFIRCVR